MTYTCGISQSQGYVDEDTVVSNIANATPHLLVWSSEALALQGIWKYILVVFPLLGRLTSI